MARFRKSARTPCIRQLATKPASLPFEFELLPTVVSIFVFILIFFEFCCDLFLCPATSSGHFVPPLLSGIFKMLSTPLALPAFTLLFFITAFQIVFAYPHQYEHDFLHGGPAWMRTQMAKAEVAKRENMCPNLPAPESWFDYSVKVRVADGEDCSSLLGPASQFVKRDYTCDENTPCSNGTSIVYSIASEAFTDSRTGACCATTGNCGYGSDYCGDRITPNSVCWSNCDAFAECGKDAQTVNATCPLNVCCSQFGFCGVTSDFCTTV